MKFQFHSGSIKRSSNIDPITDLDEFQFHSGSIKSCHKGVVEYGRPRFNSTVVRLKEDSKTETEIAAIAFQFHSGSIKSLEHEQKERYHHRFQFHSGSIKSSHRVNCKPPKFRFNSTVVRLKAGPYSYTHSLSRVSIPQWFD